MTDIELEQSIGESHPEIAEAHEDAELGIFPTLKDRVNVLTRLKLLGIKEVVVEFSGGGDSGEIDDAYACNHQGEPVDISNELIEGWEKKSNFDPEEGRWVEESIRHESMPLNELLKELCNQALEKAGLDWYNNDGGQGNLTIDFTESPPAINLEVGINYTSTENHAFNL